MTSLCARLCAVARLTSEVQTCRTAFTSEFFQRKRTKNKYKKWGPLKGHGELVVPGQMLVRTRAVGIYWPGSQVKLEVR